MNDAHQLGPLLARCRAGDQAALNDLLARLRPYVRLLVRPGLGPELARQLDASDLVQETLLRVSRGFGQFTGDDVPRLLAWIGEIAANVTRDGIRHATAEKRDARREVHGSGLLARLTGAGTPPTDRVVRDEQAARLAAALERLPAAHREVIEARFFDRLPFAAIALQAGKTEGAMRILCVRAIERLRHEIGSSS